MFAHSGSVTVMERAGVIALVEQVLDLAVPSADNDTLKTGLAAIERLTGWLESQRLSCATALAKKAAFPEHDMSAATRSGLAQAMRTLERAELVEAAPGFGAGLAAGELSGAHVEEWGRALRRLEPREQSVLVADQQRWAAVAGHTTPAQLKTALDREVRRLQADGGIDRFERQRRATRLSTGIDGDRMWFLRGVFDPRTGFLLSNRLAGEVERLFTDKTPETCPTDPVARQQHLRALALASLLQGGGGKAGRPEWVIIEDRRTGGEPVIDTGLDTQLPDAVLADMKSRAAIHAVVVEDGQVVKAPGQMNLGRSQRLASPAQRRVLRALHDTCAVGDCPITYANTKIHHIEPWEQGGSTDLANLIPVCVGHHHDIHDKRWHVTLHRDRSLTITHPDGTRMTTGPPTRGPT